MEYLNIHASFGESRQVVENGEDWERKGMKGGMVQIPLKLVRAPIDEGCTPGLYRKADVGTRSFLAGQDDAKAYFTHWSPKVPCLTLGSPPPALYQLEVTHLPYLTFSLTES